MEPKPYWDNNFSKNVLLVFSNLYMGPTFLFTTIFLEQNFWGKFFSSKAFFINFFDPFFLVKIKIFFSEHFLEQRFLGATFFGLAQPQFFLSRHHLYQTIFLSMSAFIKIVYSSGPASFTLFHPPLLCISVSPDMRFVHRKQPGLTRTNMIF